MGNAKLVAVGMSQRYRSAKRLSFKDTDVSRARPGRGPVFAGLLRFAGKDGCETIQSWPKAP